MSLRERGEDQEMMVGQKRGRGGNNITAVLTYEIIKHNLKCVSCCCCCSVSLGWPWLM